MESDKEKELTELRTELATVVEVLGVLQDFVGSVFGTKYEDFLISSSSQFEGTGNNGANHYGTNVQSAFRRLRYKSSKCDMEDSRAISTSPIGGLSRESKGDNGYSSEGTPTTMLGAERRNSVSSPPINQMPSQTTAEADRMPTTTEGSSKKGPESPCKFSLSVGRPEVVAVKCEIEDTDFLDDVDPFGSEQGDYQYEEDSDLKIDDCYPLPPTDLTNSEDNQLQATKTFGDPHSNSSPRFIPELIPIQSDPLLHKLTSLSTFKYEESATSSSDNSDSEWQPSSKFTNSSSKRQKNDVKQKFLAKPKRTTQPDRLPFNYFSANHCEGTVPLPIRPEPASSLPTGSAVGGPFKCDMCPASYKQEESLRSHQKYKHNPSRVQCTCHLCGKSMVDKYRLQRHLRLHTGEKPFECEHCGQSFYRKDYHTKHLQRKHGISYTSGPPSKIVRKSTGKSKTCILPTSSSSFIVSSSSTVTSSSFQSLRSGVTEPHSPPPLSMAALARKPHITSSTVSKDRHCFTTATTSPSSLSTSPATTSSSTSTGEISVKEYSNNFVDIFPNHPTGQSRVTSWGGDLNGGSEFCSTMGGIGNLMNMTSLTFDDLISADF